MAELLQYAQLAGRVYNRTPENRTPVPDGWSELPGFDSDLQISPLFGGPLQRRRGFEGGDRKSAVVARL